MTILWLILGGAALCVLSAWLGFSFAMLGVKSVIDDGSLTKADDSEVRCPKCGALWSHRIGSSFPPPVNRVSYRGSNAGKEWLIETCWRCGYMHDRPCADAPKAASKEELCTSQEA